MGQLDSSNSRRPTRNAKSTEANKTKHYVKSKACKLRTKTMQSRGSENLAERERISGLWAGLAMQRFPAEPRSYWGFSTFIHERRVFCSGQLAEGKVPESNLLWQAWTHWGLKSHNAIRTPTTIRYHPNSVKLCRDKKETSQRTLRIAEANAAANPTASRTAPSPSRFPQLR